MNISPINSVNFKSVIVNYGKKDEKVYSDRSELPNQKIDAKTGLPIDGRAIEIYDTDTQQRSIVFPAYNLRQMKLSGLQYDIPTVPGYYSGSLFTSEEFGLEALQPQRLNCEA